MAHRNVGAPFPREDGTTWGRGEVHEASEAELRQCAHKLRPHADVAVGGWPMVMAQELYLELEPEGDHAALAREILARRPRLLSDEER